MTLSSMVVSRDWPEVSVLECILGGLKISVDVEPEPERARTKLAKTKVDALIVDCDLEGATHFLHGLESVANTVPLVIIGSPRGQAKMKDSDATFIFKKPISVEQAVHTLSAARNLIVDGRLRYHRQTLDLPVRIASAKNKQMEATLLNLSQGGVAVRLEQPASVTGKVRVEFSLPGCDNSFKLNGEVVWGRQKDTGIRFSALPNDARRELHLWLAQRYLTH